MFYYCVITSNSFSFTLLAVLHRLQMHENLFRFEMCNAVLKTFAIIAFIKTVYLTAFGQHSA